MPRRIGLFLNMVQRYVRYAGPDRMVHSPAYRSPPTYRNHLGPLRSDAAAPPGQPFYPRPPLLDHPRDWPG